MGSALALANCDIIRKRYSKTVAFLVLVQDGFHQQYQSSVHFPLTRAVDKSQQHRNKFPGTQRIEPGAGAILKLFAGSHCTNKNLMHLAVLPRLK